MAAPAQKSSSNQASHVLFIHPLFVGGSPHSTVAHLQRDVYTSRSRVCVVVAVVVVVVVDRRVTAKPCLTIDLLPTFPFWPLCTDEDRYALYILLILGPGLWLDSSRRRLTNADNEINIHYIDFALLMKEDLIDHVLPFLPKGHI